MLKILIPLALLTIAGLFSSCQQSSDNDPTCCDNQATRIARISRDTLLQKLPAANALELAIAGHTTTVSGIEPAVNGHRMAFFALQHSYVCDHIDPYEVGFYADPSNAAEMAVLQNLHDVAVANPSAAIVTLQAMVHNSSAKWGLSRSEGIVPHDRFKEKKVVMDTTNCTNETINRSTFAFVKNPKFRAYAEYTVHRMSEQGESLLLYHSGIDADSLVALVGADSADAQIRRYIEEKMRRGIHHIGCLGVDVIYFVKSGSRLDMRVWEKHLAYNVARADGTHGTDLQISRENRVQYDLNSFTNPHVIHLEGAELQYGNSEKEILLRFHYMFREELGLLKPK